MERNVAKRLFVFNNYELSIQKNNNYEEKTYSIGFNMGYRNWCKEWSINLFLIWWSFYICLNYLEHNDIN